MKKLLGLVMSLAMVLSLGACSSSTEETGTYTPGTYTGEAQGYGGTVTVTVTTDANQITEVTIEGPDETPTVGGAALEELINQIMEAQSTEIDGVSGATMTSNAVMSALESALNQAKGVEEEIAALTDGTYSATTTGYSWTGMISGDITITDGKIADITITEEHESETGEIAQTAFDNMIPRIIENQSLATDVVTGATST